jgi:quercetin dioxygenase-like cupin family protein
MFDFFILHIIMIKAYRLYTDTDGHSYFKTGNVSEAVITRAESIRFQESPPGSVYDWHPAPTMQFVINLRGTLEFTTFKGETFTLNPGEVLIAQDTTGSGHKWRLLGSDPWQRAYVLFDQSTDINFVPDLLSDV